MSVVQRGADWESLEVLAQAQKTLGSWLDPARRLKSRARLQLSPKQT
jgi:hypothetical protein